jgi:hypothetical protein
MVAWQCFEMWWLDIIVNERAGKSDKTMVSAANF